MKKLLFIFTVVLSIFTIDVNAKEINMEKGKVLVAYFSATGTTEKLASKLANVVNGDLFEIKPAKAYTDADLNWRNEKSRSSIEMADRNSRPEISSKVENMAQYKTVFIGFPIWWAREPSIIDTFMESYDFAGKTVIPFVTSGSSDIGNTSDNLQTLASKATVLKGKRFPSSASEEDLKNWIAILE